MNYPKRLIEIDLPIARISAHARREKSIRHGHISTLHIWWARRPLAACRAVICAALWPDPADDLCPQAFRAAAVQQIRAFARRVFPEKITAEGRLLSNEKHCSPESRARREAIAAKTLTLDAGEPDDMPILRLCLLDFIADFANWDNSTEPAYLETSRALTQAAHEALGGSPGTRPLVVDPFAGGGSIPLEALRVGADAFASDLNPVAVLLNKVVLEYIPKYGQRLSEEVRKWGQWVREQAEKELAGFYPKDPDGATPIAYLWARTVSCEGPGCGAQVPLIRSMWLAKKGSRSVGLRIKPGPNTKRIDFDIIQNPKPGDVSNPTIQRGSVTCPLCGYTTPVISVRRQLAARQGGTKDARLYCKVVKAPDGSTEFRLPGKRDALTLEKVPEVLERLNNQNATVPSLELPPDGSLGFRVQKYGITDWLDLFTPRQQLMLTVYTRLIRDLPLAGMDGDCGPAVKALLGLTASKMASFSSSLCVWRNVRTCVAQTFGRQTLSMVWDFGEMNPFAESAGDFGEGVDFLLRLVEHVGATVHATAEAQQADAAEPRLPNDIADAFVTDPPYYDSIPYSHLSEFFLVWLAAMGLVARESLTSTERRQCDCIVDEGLGKGRDFYERKMGASFAEGRRVAKPDAVGTVVFAHKSTSGWESLLQAMLDAGWTITASWPIDTERSGRLRAHESAALASSVHLLCRPRENPDGTLREQVGEWRDVLAELPERIHEWMPRLAQEGIVGADAIFACLGPGLEIFSRYARVEKASGEEATLREYLEHVWGAVSTEALRMIFDEADAAGLEPDARLTAMWLWTVGAGTGKAGGNGNGEQVFASPLAEHEDVAEEVGKAVQSTGYTLEFDAARKIAQGLGVHLEKVESVVEIKGDKARLLPVAERTKYLFGNDSTAPATTRRKKKSKQMSLFAELDEIEAAEGGATGELAGASPGSTALDRVHQSMILFGTGRGEAMKRFLVEDGVGADARFWKLAQSLSALYPRGTDEKRWVDGVLARKKGLGL